MNQLKIFLFMILFFSISYIIVGKAYAQQLQSPLYRIESGSLNFQPDLTKDPSNYNVPASYGQETQKKFEETGYVIISNRDAYSSRKPFIRLVLDKSQLVFDKAEIDGEAVQRTAINVFGSGSNNFIIALRQQEKFKNSFGATIPPTVCDIADSSCTPELAKTWKTAHGFGYRAVGNTPQDFSKKDSFRSLFVTGATGQSAILFDGELNSVGEPIELEFKLRLQPQTQTDIYKGTIIITASADY